MYKLIRNIDWLSLRETFQTNTPFNHIIIDDFFPPEVADKISDEFPSFDDDRLGQYDSTFGLKKVCNSWDRFKPYTYQAFTMFGRDDFLAGVKFILGLHWYEDSLWLDYGLNGGGQHMHGPGGALNVHLDYNIHPKLGEQRKLNIIVYMAKDWNPEWGGGLEVWSNDSETNRPKEHVKTIENKFNRAVLFDTTQHSWHGFQNFLTCPEGKYRKSLAAYYVRPAPEGSDPRGKALFVAREDQKNDIEFEKLAQRRAAIDTASEFYKD